MIAAVLPDRARKMLEWEEDLMRARAALAEAEDMMDEAKRQLEEAERRLHELEGGGRPRPEERYLLCRCGHPIYLYDGGSLEGRFCPVCGRDWLDEQNIDVPIASYATTPLMVAS